MRIRYSNSNNNIYSAQQIARTLKIISGIDVFENTRKKEVIELRSLVVYILRSVENMTYNNIKQFFIINGKDYDHATALHAFNNYEMYCKYNKNLEFYFTKLVSESQSEKARKLIAKSLIDNSGVEVAETLTYMIKE